MVNETGRCQISDILLFTKHFECQWNHRGIAESALEKMVELDIERGRVLGFQGDGVFGALSAGFQYAQTPSSMQ